MEKIAFEKLIPHGMVTTKLQDGMLELTTQNSITSIAYNLTGNSYKRHYLELPQRAHIPFSLTLQLKLSHPGLIILVGEGHVLFNCPSSHALEDPVKPTGKAFLDEHRFDNNIPSDTFVTVTITYGMREMQVLVDGKEAFYTNKLPYMKAKELSQVNAEGLRIGIETAKRSPLLIKEIVLDAFCEETGVSRPMPYQSAEKSAEASAGTAGSKSTFESFLSRLPESQQQELLDTDRTLKALKTLKMKRSIDARGEKLTYTASDFGVSYNVRHIDTQWQQSFSWYIVTAGTGDTWHRRADYMEEMLQELDGKDPALAERIFFALNDCVGCYGQGCIVKTLYNFRGKKKLACHGLVLLHLCHEDFQDVRTFFSYLDKMLERKTQEGTLQTEKIFMMK